MATRFRSLAEEAANMNFAVAVLPGGSVPDRNPSPYDSVKACSACAPSSPRRACTSTSVMSNRLPAPLRIWTVATTAGPPGVPPDASAGTFARASFDTRNAMPSSASAHVPTFVTPSPSSGAPPPCAADAGGLPALAVVSCGAAQPVRARAASTAIAAIIFFMRSSSLGGVAAGDGASNARPPPLVYFCHHPATVGDRVRGPGPATPTGRARVVSRGGLGEDPRGGVDQAGDVVAAEAVEHPRDIVVVLDLQLDVEAGRGQRQGRLPVGGLEDDHLRRPVADLGRPDLAA